jgi:glycolate oxidase
MNLSQTLLRRLEEVLSPEEIIPESESALYTSDIFAETEVSAIVIRPGDRATLQRAVFAIADSGFSITTRGAGLSYSSGYIAANERWVVVDTTRLNSILEINADDLYVTVEPGVSWEKLYAALDAVGLRTPYYGPFSGRYATVGATVSQNSVFFGSATFGTAAESVLGLEVLLPDGVLVTTGSGAGRTAPTPFFRNYGPDLTGLFLSDCGAFGIKTQITLALIPKPVATTYLSAAFETAEDLLQAMSAVARSSYATECLGFDPYLLETRIASEGLTSDVGHLVAMARGRKKLSDYVKVFSSVARARQTLETGRWTLHLTIDGSSSRETATRRSVLLDLLDRYRGVETSDALPRLVRAQPFGPVNRILSPQGERWVPMHAIVPHSRAVEVMSATARFFVQNGDVLAQHQIRIGYLFMVSTRNSLVIEPTLFWPDSHYLIHRAYIEPRRYALLPKVETNMAARQAVTTLRNNLTKLYADRGATHLQIGRFYPYLETRQDSFADLIVRIKALLDPNGRMSPGSLGLSGPPASLVAENRNEPPALHHADLR